MLYVNWVQGRSLSYTCTCNKYGPRNSLVPPTVSPANVLTAEMSGRGHVVFYKKTWVGQAPAPLGCSLSFGLMNNSRPPGIPFLESLCVELSAGISEIPAGIPENFFRSFLFLNNFFVADYGLLCLIEWTHCNT